MASYFDEFLNKPRDPANPFDLNNFLSNYPGRDRIQELQQIDFQNNPRDTATGTASDFRHSAAMNELSKSLSPGFVPDFVGDSLAYGLGAINEIPDAFRGFSFREGFDPQSMADAKEDFSANYAGSFGTPNTATIEDVFAKTLGYQAPGTNIQTASGIGNPMGYGAAQASDLTNLERDFPGMSGSDIIEMMNNRGPVATNIEDAPQIKEAIYQDRIMNSNLPGFMVEPSRFQGFKNKIGSGLGSIKDFAMNKGTQGFNLARQLPGMAFSAMTGIPGIGMALGALGKMGSNEYAQATTANMQKQNNNLQSLGLDGVSNFGGVTTDDLGRITNNGLNYNTPEGIMSGYNSGFDLAGAALGRIGTIQNAIAKGRYKDKFALDRANKKIDNLKTAAVASAQAKRQAYQDKIDRAKNEAAANRARAKSITAGYGGHDDRPGATGPTATGAGMGVGGGYASDYGFLKNGGQVGVGSMFVRKR